MDVDVVGLKKSKTSGPEQEKGRPLRRRTWPLREGGGGAGAGGGFEEAMEEEEVEEEKEEEERECRCWM